MGSITVRPAEIGHADDIVDFQIHLAAETENLLLARETVAAGVKALLSDPSKGAYYVAEHEGKVVGCFLITFEWSDWRNATVWWLQSVYVRKSSRKHGVFKRMYEYITGEITNDATVIGLRLYVDKHNHRAQQVYQSLGMNGDHYTVYEWIKP